MGGQGWLAGAKSDMGIGYRLAWVDPECIGSTAALARATHLISRVRLLRIPYFMWRMIGRERLDVQIKTEFAG